MVFDENLTGERGVACHHAACKDFQGRTACEGDPLLKQGTSASSDTHIYLQHDSPCVCACVCACVT